MDVVTRLYSGCNRHMFFDKYKGERNEKVLQAMLPSSPYSNTPRLVHLKVRIYGDGKEKENSQNSVF